MNKIIVFLGSQFLRGKGSVLSIIASVVVLLIINIVHAGMVLASDDDLANDYVQDRVELVRNSYVSSPNDKEISIIVKEGGNGLDVIFKKIVKNKVIMKIIIIPSEKQLRDAAKDVDGKVRKKAKAALVDLDSMRRGY